MAFEQKNNSGSLFANDRKKSENDPDLTGSIKVDGKEFWLSGWRRQSQAGTTFLALSVRDKNAQANAAQPVDFLAEPATPEQQNEDQENA